MVQKSFPYYPPSCRSLSYRICILCAVDYPDLWLQCDQNPAILHSSLAAAFGFSMVIAFCSDRLRHRFIFTLIPMAIALIGFIMLLTIHSNNSAQYGALFMVTSGCYSAMPVIVCWFSMNLGGHHRRSVGTAWQIGFGNIGGIIATYSLS
jgi:hypothetical protein